MIPTMITVTTTTIAVTPANGSGHVCGIDCVSITSPQTVHFNSFKPLLNKDASFVVVHSPSS